MNILLFLDLDSVALTCYCRVIDTPFVSVCYICAVTCHFTDIDVFVVCNLLLYRFNVFMIY